MTKDCADLYVEFMNECTYYDDDDIEDTKDMFMAWLQKKVNTNASGTQ
jgi:hypothetical protein